MPRLVYLTGLALLLLAGAFLLTDALLWEPGVTERNVRRIQAGMSLREVEAILGGRPFYPPGIALVVGRKRPRYTVHWWAGDDGVAEVQLSQAGRVIRAVFHRQAPGASETTRPLSRLWAWLGW